MITDWKSVCSNFGHVVLAGLDAGPDLPVVVRRGAGGGGRGWRGYPLPQLGARLSRVLRRVPLTRVPVLLCVLVPFGSGDTRRSVKGSAAGRSVPPAGLHLPDIQLPQDGMEQGVKGAEVDGSLLRCPDGQVQQIIQTDGLLRHVCLRAGTQPVSSKVKLTLASLSNLKSHRRVHILANKFCLWLPCLG